MFCDQLNLSELYWNLTCWLPALLETSAHPLPVLLRLVPFSWASWSPLVWPVLPVFCLISKPIVLHHDLYVRPRPQVNSYRDNMWTPQREVEENRRVSLSASLCGWLCGSGATLNVLPRCPWARRTEGWEEVQRGNGKHHTRQGRHPLIPQTGSANWSGGLTAFSTWRVWRPPDNTESADSAASLLTVRYHTQPQCDSNTSTVAAKYTNHSCLTARQRQLFSCLF